jgi:ABC-2 type transport system permease protein
MAPQSDTAHAGGARHVARHPGGLSVLLKLAWIELKLFLREPMTIVFTFAFPVVLMFVLGEVFGNQPGGTDQRVFAGVGAMNYYAPAYIAVVTMSVGVIMLPARLTDYRSGGVLRRFRASLVPIWAVLGSQVLGALVLGAIGAVLVAAFAAIFYPVHFPDSVALLAAGFVICAAAFAAIGTLLGAVMPSPRAAQGAGLMLFFVMLFLSGASVPMEVMSGTMKKIGDFLPLTYGVDLLQGAWSGGTWDWPSAIVLIGIAIVASFLSLRVYRWG